MRKVERYQRVIEYFEEAMPVAETELHYKDAYQLIVAVVLSAQCTDKRVNMVTPALFEAYPDVYALAEAEVDDVYNYIRSVSYPNSKSRHLVGMAQGIVERYGGEVPADVTELQTLPGVGRKTANVVVSVFYNQPAMAVDTHVFRVANRIGLTRNSRTPLQTELELTSHIPAEKLHIAHHWLILHGRYTCTARSPKCATCGLAQYCAYNARQQKSNKKV